MVIYFNPRTYESAIQSFIHCAVGFLGWGFRVGGKPRRLRMSKKASSGAFPDLTHSWMSDLLAALSAAIFSMGILISIMVVMGEVSSLMLSELLFALYCVNTKCTFS